MSMLLALSFLKSLAASVRMKLESGNAEVLIKNIKPTRDSQCRRALDQDKSSDGRKEAQYHYHLRAYSLE
jgi:hypothetical protein